MSRLALNTPILVMPYGYPGSGKTTFAAELSNHISAVHLYADKIRNELFEKPRYDAAENQVVNHIMLYMAEEFLKAGLSVIYDNDLSKKKDRKILKELASDCKGKSMLAWLQIDVESSFHRVSNRDRRKISDKFALPMDRQSFNDAIHRMQNPESDEDFLVLSGKHSFLMQKSTLMKRLFDMNLLPADTMASNIVKPGMINLIPTAGRVDMARRNISIH